VGNPGDGVRKWPSCRGRGGQPLNAWIGLHRLVIGVLLSLGPTGLFAAQGVFREFPLSTAGAQTASVDVSVYGDVWFTQFAANKIGRISRTGELTVYSVPTAGSGPLGITTFPTSPDAWFTEFNANKIGRITREGVITEFAIPTPASGPFGITGEISDDAVWFTEFNGNRLGRVSLAGVITEFAIPTADSGPMGITRGPYGTDIWFTEFRANKIGWMFREGGTVHEIAIPTPNSGPTDIANFGSLWFTEFNANRIGKITVQLTGEFLEEFVVPTPDSGPSEIDVRQDGSAWFTEKRAKKIGSIDASGAFTEYPVRGAGADLSGISADGSYVWFTDRASRQVVRMARDAVVLVGTGVSGTWDTEFRFANPSSSSQGVYLGLFLEPNSICAGFCHGQTGFDLPPQGSASLRASAPTFGGLGPLFGDLETVYARGSSGEEPPTVIARVFDTARPSQGIEVPTIRLSTLTDRNPFVLAFPSASRGAGVHANLVVAEVGSDDEISVRVDAFSPGGELLGSNSFRIEASTTLFLVDALAQLGVSELDGGQIRVTKTGGTGLMWGLLATLTDDGGVTVSPGMNP
jgi:virginiamycin B lyase